MRISLSERLLKSWQGIIIFTLRESPSFGSKSLLCPHKKAADENSERMYKTRIKQWKFTKHNTRKEVAQMLRTRFIREMSGRRSEFIRTGTGRTIDLDKYLHRKGLTEYDVVDLDSPEADALLRAVRCRTPPEPMPLDPPDRLRLHENFLQGMRRVIQFWATDPREHDYHWHSPGKGDYPHILGLHQVRDHIWKGETAKGVERLSGILTTGLVDIERLDGTGALWLLLHPGNMFTNAPMILYTLYKYVTYSLEGSLLDVILT